MKKILYISLTLLTLIGVSSCSQEDELEVVEQSDYYTVKLDVTGDIWTESSPLTRSSSTDDLLGIQVDSISKSGSVTHFCYGLFDNFDNIKLNLVKDRKCRITSTMVKDGKNRISKYNSVVYYQPFNLYSRHYHNEYYNGFSYYGGTYYYFEGLNGNEIFLNESGTTTSNYPEVDRLYSLIENYRPTVNGTLSLNMKRVSFGLKYEVSGLDEGTLKIKVKNSSRTFVDVSNVENGCNSETKYFQFSNIQTPYNRTDNYYETVTVTVSHKHSFIDYEEDLGSVDVKVYRNKENNLRINLSTIMLVKGRDNNVKPRSIVSMEYEDIKD